MKSVDEVKKGDIAVRLTDGPGGQKIGKIHKAWRDVEDTRWLAGRFPYDSGSAMCKGDWRYATLQEIKAYENGILNINDISTDAQSFTIGDKVVIKETTAWFDAGTIGEITRTSNDSTLKIKGIYKVYWEYNSHLRKATTEEADAYSRGVDNIKDINSTSDSTHGFSAGDKIDTHIINAWAAQPYNEYKDSTGRWKTATVTWRIMDGATKDIIEIKKKEGKVAGKLDYDHWIQLEGLKDFIRDFKSTETSTTSKPTHKFKVGDKVTVKQSGSGCGGEEIGKAVTITELGVYSGKPGYRTEPKVGNGITGSYDGICGEASFKLYERPIDKPAVIDKPTVKFNVGDRVEILKGPRRDHSIGDVGVIKKFDTGFYRVFVEGKDGNIHKNKTIPYLDSELKRTDKPLTSSNDSSYKIGDIVVVTKEIRGNEANVCSIGKIIEMDDSTQPYCISGEDANGEPFTASWCRDVRAATFSERVAYVKRSLHIEAGMYEMGIDPVGDPILFGTGGEVVRSTGTTIPLISIKDRR